LKTAAIALERYRFALHPVLGELAKASASDALAYGITFYDASYLALAQLHGRQMYTADEKLLAKVTNVKGVAHVDEYRRRRRGVT
ncbi:MAG: type II toxin-antitoxin system VapC family toxin, partial [Thermoprotei archaeon]